MNVLPPAGPLLDINGLTVRYAGSAGPMVAARDISFRLAAGSALGIVGESGSGKSSIAGAILDLLRTGAAIDGSIVFEGTELATLAPPQRRAVMGRRIGSVFQDPFTALNPAPPLGRRSGAPVQKHQR